MQTVLFLSNASRFQLDPLVEGVRPVARKAHWNLQVIGDVKSHDDVRTLLDFWHPQGCIIQNSTRPDLFVDELFGGLPVVRIDLDPALTRPGDLVVLHDSAAAGRLAARELLSLGLSHFAYVRAERDLFWCRERGLAFRESLALNHRSCLISEGFNPSQNSDLYRIRAWLAGLPRPIGLFTSNDGVGEMTVAALRELDLSVPQDVAVVSVDNCENICENMRPTLSSICPDFVRAGALAADLLERKFSDPALPGTVLRYGQTGIVRRQSSRRFTGRDARINGVLEAIRVQAADPDFSYEGLAVAAGCTLRSLEMRFRAATGRTLRDELHEQRVERAKRLLEQTALPVAEVAVRSGFRSLATFARVFGSATGTSPRRWRVR